jgi:hypothetical protein
MQQPPMPEQDNIQKSMQDAANAIQSAPFAKKREEFAGLNTGLTPQVDLTSNFIPMGNRPKVVGNEFISDRVAKPSKLDLRQRQ